MKFSAFKSLTRLEQTLFGLPFILAGAFLSLPHAHFSIRWLWIFPAFLLARISGMAFNQLIDCKIDALNVRTKHRAIPAGLVTLTQARIVAWGALALFLFVCFKINALTFLLALMAAPLLYIYSYMKRLHYSCHFILGCIHLLGPVMAYTAICASVSTSSFFLGAAACFSIVGSDIVYAIQDYEFDTKNALFSIPIRLGIERALMFAAVVHAFCLLMLLAVGITAKLPFFYYLLLPLSLSIFANFHLTIRKKKHRLKDVESTFFFCTIAISLTTFLFIATSCLWRAIS